MGVLNSCEKVLMKSLRIISVLPSSAVMRLKLRSSSRSSPPAVSSTRRV